MLKKLTEKTRGLSFMLWTEVTITIFHFTDFIQTKEVRNGLRN